MNRSAYRATLPLKNVRQGSSYTQIQLQNPIDGKVDGIRAKLDENYFTLRKATVAVNDQENLKPRSRDMSPGPPIICCMCKKPGNVASKCELNPERVESCTYCVKMGFDESNCWTKRY